MINIKFVLISCFAIVLILDPLIKYNYLGSTINKYYYDFLGMHGIYKFVMLYIMFFILLTIFNCLDIALINYDNNLFDLSKDLFDYMGDSKGADNKGVNLEGNGSNNNINFNH